MSSIDSPARWSTFLVAGMGPVSMSSGSSPTTEKEWKRDRRDPPVETAGGGGRRGPLVGAGGVLVELLAVELPPGGDQLGGHALVDQTVGVAGGHGRAERVPAARRGAHR